MTTRLTYLDHAATTPVRPEVLDAMLPYLRDEAFGNPSSAHRFGRAARAGIEHAKRAIAQAVGAEPNQVIFTSGGTEADNLAVIGAALAARDRGGPFRVAVAATEHKAVLAAAHAVTHLGGEEVILPVAADGTVREAALQDALARGVALVSVMWVNNEVGTVQPIARLADRCRAAGAIFHSDAVQAFGKVPVTLRDLACTLLTISGHKIGAPKGIGALIVRDPHAVAAIIHGGGQQFGLRPGTENVPGIIALGRAAELAAAEQAELAPRLAALRERLAGRVRALVPDAVIHGADTADRQAPHVLNVSIPGTDSEAMLMHLDLAGVACSAGSACSTGSVEPSHVLTAMGVPPELGTAALRFSFGRSSSEADVEALAAVFPKIVEKVRALAVELQR
jgi:cysteine desulfurase